MYRIAISKFSDGMVQDEVFRFKVENVGELYNDMQVLKFVKNHCRLGYSVCVDPMNNNPDGSFISYRSHDGQPVQENHLLPGNPGGGYDRDPLGAALN